MALKRATKQLEKEKLTRGAVQNQYLEELENLREQQREVEENMKEKDRQMAELAARPVSFSI